MIIRTEKTKNYSVIHNEIFRNKDISAKAKGIYAYIMTLPDDWKLYQKELVTHFKDGRESIAAGMEELEQAGYIEKERLQAEDGTFYGWGYCVHEKSMFQPKSENPNADKPNADNLLLLSTKIQPITKNTTNSRFAPPPLDEIAIYMSTLQGFEKGDDCAMHDYYTANGWRVGRAVMKDWKATCRTWLRNKVKWAKPKKPSFNAADVDKFAEMKQRIGQ